MLFDFTCPPITSRDVPSAPPTHKEGHPAGDCSFDSAVGFGRIFLAYIDCFPSPVAKRVNPIAPFPLQSFRSSLMVIIFRAGTPPQESLQALLSQGSCPFPGENPNVAVCSPCSSRPIVSIPLSFLFRFLEPWSGFPSAVQNLFTPQEFTLPAFEAGRQTS